MIPAKPTIVEDDDGVAGRVETGPAPVEIEQSTANTEATPHKETDNENA